MNAKKLSAFLCATLIGVAVADTATAEKAEDQGPAIAAEAMAKTVDLQTVSGGEFVPYPFKRYLSYTEPTTLQLYAAFRLRLHLLAGRSRWTLLVTPQFWLPKLAGY